MRNLLPLLLLPLAGLALAGTVTWRWVDADGVHYSDQEHEGAERIVLGETQTYRAVPVAPTSSPSPARRGAGAAGEPRNDSCFVTQPTNDQVMFEAESVTVAVGVSPAPRGGDRISLVFDGKVIDGQSGQMQFRISPIDRGEHTASVVVHDASGRQVCQSKGVTFFVRQPSVLTPARPGRH